MAVREVAFTTDGAGNSNVRAWDLETGGLIAAYPGGVSQPHTLSFIRGDYVLSAQRDKTAFSLWSFRQYDQINKKFAAPGKVRAMDVSPCGSFCVAGIESELYIWDVQTGMLLGIIPFHYQGITCVKFTADGSHFISTSLDSLIAVWCIGVVESLQMNETPQPLYTFKEHTQAVSDVAIRGELIAAVSTSGLLTVHSLKTGWLEYKKNFGKAIDAVAISPPRSAVFLGFRSGVIVRLSLSDEKELEFTGHGGPIRCLSASLHLLLSGSDDCTARLWDADHGHMIQTLRHDGSVTNARIAVLPSNAIIKDPDRNRALIAIRNFQRTVTVPDTIRAGFDRVDALEDVDVSVNVEQRQPSEARAVDQAETREKMAKIALANSDMVNYLVARM